MAEAVLRLGKNTEQRYADATKPHKGLDRYAFVPLPVRFTDSDIDQARAAGVLIEFAHGRPIIVEHSLYRELVKSAINRTHDELRAKAAAAVKNKQAARATEAPADPLSSAKRERTCSCVSSPTRRTAPTSTSGTRSSKTSPASTPPTSTWRGSSPYADVRIGRTMPPGRQCRRTTERLWLALLAPEGITATVLARERAWGVVGSRIGETAHYQTKQMPYPA
jgi:hypothetical protein